MKWVPQAAPGQKGTRIDCNVKEIHIYFYSIFWALSTETLAYELSFQDKKKRFKSFFIFVLYPVIFSPQGSCGHFFFAVLYFLFFCGHPALHLKPLRIQSILFFHVPQIVSRRHHFLLRLSSPPLRESRDCSSKPHTFLDLAVFHSINFTPFPALFPEL